MTSYLEALEQHESDERELLRDMAEKIQRLTMQRDKWREACQRARRRCTKLRKKNAKHHEEHMRMCAALHAARTGGPYREENSHGD